MVSRPFCSQIEMDPERVDIMVNFREMLLECC